MNDLSVLGYPFSEIMGGDEIDALVGELLGQDDLSGQDDLLGEVLGDNDMSVLGALLRAKGSAGAAAIRKAAAARKLANASVVVKKDPTSSGVEPLGFRSTAAIAAGAQATITTRPQTLYRPERLVVPASIAPFFTIDDIKVGNRSQFPSAEPLPAEMFTQQADAVTLRLDTVNPAIDLILVVTNISGGAQDFRAGFIGRAVG